jgi:hypothetical protein
LFRVLFVTKIGFGPIRFNDQNNEKPMATKAELESKRQKCHTLAMQAIAAERGCDYARAIEIALESLLYLDEAMQFEKKYMKIEHPPSPSIDLIFRCAPCLFRSDALDRVQQLIDGTKRIERLAGRNLKRDLDKAREVLDSAVRLWSEIEAGRECQSSSILEIWHRCGLIETDSRTKPGRWRFRTQFEGEIQAKCAACGRISQGAKWRFLSEIQCPGCSKLVNHVILAVA